MAKVYTTTIRLSKAVHGLTFKKRANKAVKAIRKFCVQQFKADEVSLSTSVNQYVWSQGIRNPPRKIRVEVTKTVDENNKVVCAVEHIPVTSFKDLHSEVAEDEE